MAIKVKPQPTLTESQEPEEPTPTWLLAKDEALPEALRAIYAQLPREVTHVCEQARKAMRDTYVRSLIAVRDALAPSGLFQDWCRAVGLNYNTANSTIARAEQKARDAEAEAEEQAGDGATHNR